MQHERDPSDLERIFSKFSFHPVIHLPTQYEVLDLTQGYSREKAEGFTYSVGRYDERRMGMYTTELFTKDASNVRDVHVGVDLGAPEGTVVHAFDQGTVFCATIHSAPGDYGGTLITKHTLGDLVFWVLHGHLSHESVRMKKPGDVFQKGDALAKVGSFEENGGWNPHLHFQLTLEEPLACDLPGAVSATDRSAALQRFPDPRLILGKIYS